MKALVTAARSNNLKPLTHTMNKHLIPLANKPMIFYALEHIASAGITDIGIVINENETEVPEIIGDGSRFNSKITYIKQTGGTLGLGHVIKVAREFLGDEKFLLYLGDNIIIDDLASLVRDFEESSLNCMLTLARVQNPHRFGVPEFKDGQIIRVEERPIHPKSEYAVAGLYFYDKSAHRAAENIKPSFRGDYEISDIHTWLVQNDYNVSWREIKNWWKDRGDPSDLLEGNKLVLSLRQNSVFAPPASKTSQGHSEASPHAKALADKPADKQGTVQQDINIRGSIEATARIEGDVTIGEGTRIGGKSLIRGPVSIWEYCLIKDSYIGPSTSIGNKVEMHGGDIEHSMVFDDVSIVTPTKIVNSIIGPGSTISAKYLEMPEGNKIIVGKNSTLSI